MISAEVHAFLPGRFPRGPTCDIGRHQSLGSDDLHLHHTDIFQVVEGSPNALKHHRHGVVWGGGVAKGSDGAAN